jgi:ABC-type nitrate/sulfonate/bicarbonate transport system substrate-binding protein
MTNNKTAILCGLLATLALGGAPAAAKDIVTLVHPTDPAFEASVWPIQNGKVTSDKVDVQVSFTSIQAVIQAAGTQQYDLIPMVTNILPKLVERGVPVKLIATNQRYSFKGGGSRLYVAADGPIKSMADLKGKTIGVTSLNSSGVTATRVVMAQLFKANVALDGGDYKWVEMPLAVLPTALISGRIDAAILSNQYDYQAYQNHKDYRLLFPEGLKDALGVAVPGTVILGYTPKLNARPEAFVEAVKLLKASADYVRSHPDEVFGAVAKKNDIDPGYLKWYYEYYADIPYDLTKNDLKGIEAFWGAVEKLHMVGATPKLQDLIWDKVKVE